MIYIKQLYTYGSLLRENVFKKQNFMLINWLTRKCVCQAGINALHIYMQIQGADPSFKIKYRITKSK